MLCQAMGKRICDAHEWEGACAGALLPPDYRFDLAKGVTPGEAVERMRAFRLVPLAGAVLAREPGAG